MRICDANRVTSGVEWQLHCDRANFGEILRISARGWEVGVDRSSPVYLNLYRAGDTAEIDKSYFGLRGAGRNLFKD
jgi:hypothetical protein